MPLVTALKAQQKNKERVSLYLDDEFAASLSLEEAARLAPGQSLNPAELDALLDASAMRTAIDRALNYLSYRPRSAEEARRHLLKKSTPPAVVSRVIERLREREYVDDAAFARFWIDSRRRHKPMGMRGLRYELRQKGIADGIVESALAEYDELEAATCLARERAPRFLGGSPREFRRKLGGLLQRRGFDDSLIRDLLRDLQAELEECDPGAFPASEESAIGASNPN